jgi:hypothetical protein
VFIIRCAGRNAVYGSNRNKQSVSHFLRLLFSLTRRTGAASPATIAITGHPIRFITMADKQPQEQDGERPPNQPGGSQQPPNPPQRTMYPVPPNYGMQHQPTDGRPPPQAQPPRPMYMQPAIAGRPLVPYHPGRPPMGPYMARHPMGPHPLMNQYTMGPPVPGHVQSAAVGSAQPMSSASKPPPPPAAAESAAKSALPQPQKPPAKQSAQKAKKKTPPKISGSKKPTLIKAKTPMNAVQPIPSFSSRPPRWTETEVSYLRLFVLKVHRGDVDCLRETREGYHCNDLT